MYDRGRFSLRSSQCCLCVLAICWFLLCALFIFVYECRTIKCRLQSCLGFQIHCSCWPLAVVQSRRGLCRGKSASSSLKLCCSSLGRDLYQFFSHRVQLSPLPWDGARNVPINNPRIFFRRIISCWGNCRLFENFGRSFSCTAQFLIVLRRHFPVHKLPEATCNHVSDSVAKHLQFCHQRRTQKWPLLVSLERYTFLNQ